MDEWQDDKMYEVDGSYLNALKSRVRELANGLEPLVGSAERVLERLSAGQSPDDELPALREHIASARQILGRQM